MVSLHEVIGPDQASIAWWQMSVRGVTAFLFLWALLRLGDRRALGHLSAFDIVVGMIVGSALSRAVTGNSPFIPTLATSGMLILLHAALGKFSAYSKAAEMFLKGRKLLLVQDGELLPDRMRKASITEQDLTEALRATNSGMKLAQVKSAYLERNGKISFIFAADGDVRNAAS